ncbi:DNA repair protein RadA [Skermania piniformis]|uniref:DNA repair protein RadA n=1 Tax=Skermania pinensis TaxID=39122 RepID=A0ABX8S9G7_9ACTN|nr:DNA repair protein RadA [Skermania piniformis]QXQ13624.1 DNA repair protein RadA [Skermania piniformis]
MAKPKSVYQCSACGHEAAKWLGRCPDCAAWGSIADDPTPRAATSGLALRLTSTPATAITRIDARTAVAKSTGSSELDRVLGGGIVAGSVVLLAGEPGVGKSTLLLDVVHRWAQRSADDRALYVTGEESAQQVRLRADRTGALHDRIYLAAESDLAVVLSHAEQVRPSLLVVDSVQTIYATDVDGVRGGVTQVRAVTAALTSFAKATGIAVLVVGHVTKDGAVAGPRSLEHLVDVVLHFEGDRHSTLRLVRGIKNRFGAADEVGCFELRDDGIVGVSDPSGLFLHHHTAPVAGTAITVVMDGKRPLLGELQALVVPTQAPMPRRSVSGLDASRVAMVVAVLDSRCKITLGQREVYAATVGGMRVTEPAADLALAVAIATAAQNTEIRPTVALGEVGLAGEVRRVTGLGRRLSEAQRLGFEHALVPPNPGPVPAGIRVTEISTVADAIAVVQRR